ncbi:MAG: peptidylprolyl isomerase [Pseudomonadota bacterium]|nr:peptidylprolyl isomerase [Pseudomonadota bacterium]
MAQVLKASPASDWRALDPANTLYLELPAGRVVIELAPAFAPRHVANIKQLVQQKYFDGLAIVRAQDNYVVQWGDPDETRSVGDAKAHLPAEFARAIDRDLAFTRLPDRDTYAPQVGLSAGFPVARDPAERRTWLAHCYGMVGAGRDNASDSGGGTELYVVIGHAPRHLDRNVTLVGRVVQGMPLLSTLPRGTAELGFYEKPEQRVPISAVRLAADVAPAERSKLEVLRTDSATFGAVVQAQRFRGGDWYKYSAGHIELCNVPIPVRAVAAP